jgi:hypothetical protein
MFKNSMTKNVALVDDELQGKQYTSNKGGSGFGKFRELPNPKVISWSTHDDIDVFVGSHDGFENVGVDYSRQVINVKNQFWIVKDNFKSSEPHEYKQVWQGHYSKEHAPDLLRSTFEDGSGLDIYQLNKTDEVKTDGRRGKQWSVVSKKGSSDYSFITILFPFDKFDKRINEDQEIPELNGWKLNDSKWTTDNKQSISLTKGETSIFFSVKILEFMNTKIEFEEYVDVIVTQEKDKPKIQFIDRTEGQFAFK